MRQGEHGTCVMQTCSLCECHLREGILHHHQTKLADLPSLDPGLHSIPTSTGSLIPTLPALRLGCLPAQWLQLQVGQCHLCYYPAFLQQQDGVYMRRCCTVYLRRNLAVESGSV